MAQAKRPIDIRPDPDALLALAGQDGRGRMKVFLGAAPGVGKTYAMLQGARRLSEDGGDVVVGLVETHGRQDTAALLSGLEILPRRIIDYRGRRLEEFDLDAALARKPKLLVLDELAHTNPDEFRHPKRWQDADELLAAGIDVWTTLNIQHVESLADIVARITGITVRETVPDKVINEAHDVVLVDITPDELIARLKDGKVYVPETARRATQNFFTPGNLTALRELALRRTADRVDDQVADYRRQTAIEGPWGSGERLLVCIGPGESTPALVRSAGRLATALNASWLALHLTKPGEDEADGKRALQLRESLQLVERLGGEVMRASAVSFPVEVLRTAARENVTQIVVGQARSGRFLPMRRSLADELIRRAGDIAVHVIPSEPIRQSRWSWDRSTWLSRQGAALDALAAAVSVGLAIAIGHFAGLLVSLPNVSMIFLAAVLFCALRRGTRAAVVASILSFFGYNFFFIRPLYTFTIAEPHEVFALMMFLVVAVLIGSLAGRARQQAKNVAHRAAMTQALYEFSRRLSAISQPEEILWAAATQIHKNFGARAQLLVPLDGELELKAAWPPEEALDAANKSAARWALEKAEAAGWRTPTLPTLSTQYRPLRSPRAVVGVCGFGPADLNQALSVEDENMLTAILDQTAIALDRAQLVDEAVKAAALQENEAVRDALLASLSHDLRTPLATITGAVTSLRELGDRMSETERMQMLTSIEEESGRLTRFVANLLDMSRIESGALKVRRDWVDVGDVIRAAADRSRKAFPKYPTKLSIEPGLPFVRGDATLLEQVLFNLLDNAHKYGGDADVAIHARRDDGQVMISVTDDGPGIRPADLERVFEKFYRGGRVDGRRAGTGLGLSICRGLVAAMGGTVEAQSPAVRRRGTRIVVRLPIAEAIEIFRSTEMTMQRVLVVDDEPQIQQFLRVALNAAGYETIPALTGAEALKLAATAAPDIVVLDLGLPDRDGKSVLQDIRTFSKVPIIILSARDREVEKIAALDLGANDYVEKPFGIGELMARLRVAIRQTADVRHEQTLLRFGSLIIDFEKRLVTKSGNTVRLTPREYDLLAVLARNAGRVMTHKQILSSLWGPAHQDDTQYLRVFVGQLRSKIEPDPGAPALVRTEPGVGYQFAEPDG